MDTFHENFIQEKQVLDEEHYVHTDVYKAFMKLQGYNFTKRLRMFVDQISKMYFLNINSHPSTQVAAY
jgi:hypothetical protein